VQLRERETELRKLVEQMKKEKEDSMLQMSQLQQGMSIIVMRILKITRLWLFGFLLFLEACKVRGLAEDIEKLHKQCKQEQLLKAQAVNKLAEIMNRKDNNPAPGKGKHKMSSTDVKRKEKECRKLQQELTQVSCYELIGLNAVLRIVTNHSATSFRNVINTIKWL